MPSAPLPPPSPLTPPRRAPRFPVFALVLVLAAPACATVPYTGRRQLAIMSDAEERELGASAYGTLRQQSRISSDQAGQAVVTAIGRRLAAVAERPDWIWEFTLFDAPKQVNAWALPGGKVGVYSGLFPVAESEAGLAAVLGHEVAHAIAHHGAERAGQGTVLGVLGAGVGIAAAAFGLDGSSAMQLFGVGSEIGVRLPFSRSQESEADEIGLILMARAGYDPRAALALWERMAAQADGSASDFLSTHPRDSARVERIRAALPGALAYYRGDGGDDRRLPGVAEVAPAPSSADGHEPALQSAVERKPALQSADERELALQMRRLDRVALDPRGAERVAFAIADEVAVAPDVIVGVLAEHELTAGEGALAFVLAAASRRPIESFVAAAARTSWQIVARESGVDAATLVVRLTHIADAAG